MIYTSNRKNFENIFFFFVSSKMAKYVPKRNDHVDPQGDVLVLPVEKVQERVPENVISVSHTEAERILREKKPRSEKQIEATKRLVEANKKRAEEKRKSKLEALELENRLKAQPAPAEKIVEKLQNIEEKEGQAVVVVKPKRVYKPRTKKIITKTEIVEAPTETEDEEPKPRPKIVKVANVGKKKQSRKFETSIASDEETTEYDTTDVEEKVEKVASKIQRKEEILNKLNSALHSVPPVAPRPVAPTMPIMAQNVVSRGLFR